VSNQVRVVESYRDYCPPRGVKRAIGLMLNSVPDRYLSGLDSVVLTDLSALTAKRRHGGFRSANKKVRATQRAGMYHGAQRNALAWIELFVDNIFGRCLISSELYHLFVTRFWPRRYFMSWDIISTLSTRQSIEIRSRLRNPGWRDSNGATLRVNIGTSWP